MRRFAGSPVRRFAGSPVRRFAGSPVRRFAGHLPRRFAGGIICCIAIGRTRRALCAAGQKRRLFHYKRAASFQLRHAVLEVVRTEWSTNASSWKQGRSAPAVTVDSKGLTDGRHHCFEVSPMGVDLFCRRKQLEVDAPVRGSPVRRFADSPVCADSPVY